DDEDRQPHRRRQQPDLDRQHGDDAEPDQVDAERGGDRQRQRHGDEHGGGGIEDGAQQHQHGDVEDEEAVDPDVEGDDPLGEEGGQAGQRQHAAVHGGGDDEEADRRGDVAGLDGDLPQHPAGKPALEEGDDDGAQRADGAGLG